MAEESVSSLLTTGSLSVDGPHFWINQFKSHTIKTTCIKVSNEFIEYLHSDGIILPKNAIVQTLGRDELSDDEDLRPEHKPQVIEAPSFQDLNIAIDNAIREYGGKVFVKFHTKAPIDSGWINGGTLACHTSGDVYMLLKSSSKVAECIEENNGATSSPYLIIRKWANLHPSMEFRCFVREKNIVGICQRNCADFFEFLTDLDEISRLRQIILNFFELRIRNIYPHDSYVLDVYIDKKQRVWIIDFDEFSSLSVNSLLFTWDELRGETHNTNHFPSNEVPFLVVTHDGDRLPYELGSSRGPIDLVEVPDAVQMMMSLTNRKNYPTYSSDEDNNDNEEDDS